MFFHKDVGMPSKIRSAVGWRYLKEKHAGRGHPSFLGKTVLAGNAMTVVSSAELMFFLTLCITTVAKLCARSLKRNQTASP